MIKVESFLSELESIKKVFRKQILTANYKLISPNEISWTDYKSGIFKNLYAKEYETIIRNRQYSFLFTDNKGCIQFFYLYKNELLEKVKMAYYPYPVVLAEEKDEYENMLADTNDEIIMEYYYDLWNIFNHNFELNINDENLKKLVEDSHQHGNDESIENMLLSKLEYKYSATNTSHFRIDYDSMVTSHHKCEIQIGAINNIRMPMEKLISPFMFFEFIFKNIFKDEFAEIKNKSDYSPIVHQCKKNSILINPFIESNIFNTHL